MADRICHSSHRFAPYMGASRDHAQGPWLEMPASKGKDKGRGAPEVARGEAQPHPREHRGLQGAEQADLETPALLKESRSDERARGSSSSRASPPEPETQHPLELGEGRGQVGQGTHRALDGLLWRPLWLGACGKGSVHSCPREPDGDLVGPRLLCCPVGKWRPRRLGLPPGVEKVEARQKQPRWHHRRDLEGLASRSPAWGWPWTWSVG